jgi:predicted transcriptional regulator
LHERGGIEYSRHLFGIVCCINFDISNILLANYDHWHHSPVTSSYGRDNDEKDVPMSDEFKGGNDLLTLTADIVAAHVSNNTVAVSDLPNVIEHVYNSLAKLGSPVSAPAVKQEPAVSIRSSIKPDHIVCLEDGKKLKMLKRHLWTHYKMTPDQYRTKWGLAADYPMVAPNYAEQRRTLAKKIGLGTSRKKGRGR